MSISIQDPDFFPARLGQTIHNGKYEIIRKLSSGICSTTWLVKGPRTLLHPAPRQSEFWAAKILTLDATRRHHNGQTHELKILKAIVELFTSCVPVLLEHFEIQGPRGSHICFIMHLLSTDISSFRNTAPTKALAPYIVKNIVFQVLTSLIELHELGIVHADVKLDNLLFDTVPGLDLHGYLSMNPVAIQGEYEVDGQKYPILPSQPIPCSLTWNIGPARAESMTTALVDMGQAQWAGTPVVNASTESALRAPELILQSDFGPKVDIWAVGCIAFELLVGNSLFNPEGGEGWRLEDDHLARMMELTGESFSKAVLEGSRCSDEYFDDKGNLFRRGDPRPTSLEEALENYNLLPPEEIEPAASFIRACLHLDSTKRVPAEELAFHPWLRGGCHCGFCTQGFRRLDPERITHPNSPFRRR